MSQADRLLNLVQILVAGKSWHPEDLSKVTGVILNPVPSESHSYFTVLRSGPGSTELVDQLELRIASEESMDNKYVIIIKVNKLLKIQETEVTGWFGRASEILAPTPRQPDGIPLYRVYQYDWGELRFGYSKQKDRELQTIVIDRAVAVPPEQ